MIVVILIIIMMMIIMILMFGIETPEISVSLSSRFSFDDETETED